MLQITCDDGWAQAAKDALKQQCLNAAENNITNWETDENGTATGPNSVVDKLCLNNCSSQGTCQGGKVHIFTTF